MPWLKREPVKKKKPVINTRTNKDYPFYNSTRWRKYSRAYRTINPLCEIALDRGETKGADVTDHIIPISQGGAKWDKRNHCAMSHYWHNRKRNLESRGVYCESRKNEQGELIPYNQQSVYDLIGVYWP